jgi:CrcB protein
MVFLGGGLGSVARYGISKLIISYSGPSVFPWATLSVNILACLFMGYLATVVPSKLNETQRAFLIFGFCGGFSTFSTFSLENVVLFQQKAFLFLALNIVLSVGLCFGMIFWLSKLVNS